MRASRVLWVYCESQKENERLLAVLTLSESRQTVCLIMSEVTVEKMTEKRKGKVPSSYFRLIEESVQISKEKRELSLGVRFGKLPLRRT